jgi:uncharacterized protein involved in response to NO
LLPILGIGPFIFPRLLGVPNPHDFPESRHPPPAWTRKALYALAAGVLIITSFVLEALAWHRTAYAVRFAVTLIYLMSEVSFQQVLKRGNVLALSIPVALLSLVAGFGGIALFPGYRTSLLHMTLIGGFAVITLAVATRVIFGHSGNGRLLQNPNRWLIVSIGLILLGMATRMSSDFFPKVAESHFIYGAFLWIAGVLLWSVYVLPKVLIVDTEK